MSTYKSLIHYIGSISWE